MKNKILRCTAVLLVIVSLFTVTAFAAEYVHGDVDKDGSISNSDLLLVARYYVGLSTMSDEQIKAADFNEDGEITNTDIINVARIVSGLDEGELVSDFEPILISTGNNDSTKEET
ncbi:MAG: dockerin type I repeat-containing protein, partial [Oscillospiraceae bacterium]|nr:dockerin type I repeat-containing protein [Oscillospiraceae bacterium]